MKDKSDAIRTSVTVSVPQLVAEDIQRLRDLFPQAFAEEKIEFEKLRSSLGDIVDTGTERFTFSWAGKRNSILILQMPTRSTLVPVQKESIKTNSTQNLFIEGDNLEVLKLLYKSYFGLVKLIYLDPPYNTGNDFVYPDNYSDPLDTYLKITGQRDSAGNLQTSNPETSGRKHSAWLSMMYPRLFLARQLLSDDGVIFVSIDNNELGNLKLLMNEIFGEENFVGTIIVQSNPRGRQLEKFIATSHEYLLMYARNVEFTALYNSPLTEAQRSEYDQTEEKTKRKYRPLGLRKRGAFSRRVDRPNLHFPLYVDTTTREVFLEKAPKRVEVIPRLSDGKEGVWRWSKQKIARDRDKLEGRVVSTRDEWDVFEKDYLDEHGEEKTTMYKSLWADKQMNYEFGKDSVKELFGEAVFDAPKPVELMKRIIRMGSAEDDIVLDFFAGSCTTAQAVLELNREDGGSRRFIMVQLQERTPEDSIAVKAGFATISDIGKERIKRVIEAMKKKENQTLQTDERKTPEDLGFNVFRLAESNYKPWKGIADRDPEKYAHEMKSHLDPLVEGWKKLNVIYEVAIKEGYGLNSAIEKEDDYPDNEIWRVTDTDKEQTFFICLDNKVKLSTIRKLHIEKTQLLVCRDLALDDTAVANLALNCRLKTI